MTETNLAAEEVVAPPDAQPPERSPSKRAYMRNYMKTYRGARERVRLELGSEGCANLAVVRANAADAADLSNSALVERLLAREAAALQAEVAKQDKAA
ncbi:MAG: hypothetical protein ACRYHQ_30905 [Janthinobacterium lividum]